MGQTIEEKIVSVRFECDETDRKFRKMRNEVDSVTESVNDFGAARGFTQAEERIDSVNAKFSTLQFVVSNVLSNIVSGAISAGIQFAKAMSIDNVIAGYQKYEQQQISIQTMLTATTKAGESQVDTLKRINKEMDKYMWYADETSMTYDSMISNASLILSKGKELAETSDFIMGVSAWGMGDGANASQINNVMYQLSQAAGSYVKRQDWMSVKTAGMSDSKFIQNAIDTAKEMHELSETSNVTLENFESTLSDGWFTFEVLMATVAKYSTAANVIYDAVNDTGITATEFLEAVNKYSELITDAMEAEERDAVAIKLGEEYGIATDEAYKLREALDKVLRKENELGLESFKNSQNTRTLSQAIESVRVAATTKFTKMFSTVFGDFFESTELWTEFGSNLYDIFIEPMNDFMLVLAKWKDLGEENGGRDSLVTAFNNIQTAVMNFVEAVKEVWGKVFTPVAAEAIGNIVKKFESWTETLASKDWETFKIYLEAFLRVIKFTGKIVSATTRLVKPFIDMLWKMSAMTLPYITKFVEKITSLFNTDGPMFKFVDKTIEAVEAVTGVAWKYIKNSFENSTLYDEVDSWWAGLKEKIAGSELWKTSAEWFNSTFNGGLALIKENISFKGMAKSMQSIMDFAWDMSKPILTIAENVWFTAFDFIIKSLDKLSEITKRIREKIKDMSLFEFWKYLTNLKMTIKKGLKIIFWIWGMINFQRILRGFSWLLEGWADLGEAVYKLAGSWGKSLRSQAVAAELKGLATLLAAIVGTIVSFAILFSNPKYVSAIATGTIYVGLLFVALFEFIKILDNYVNSAVVPGTKKKGLKGIIDTFLGPLFSVDTRGVAMLLKMTAFLVVLSVALTAFAGATALLKKAVGGDAGAMDTLSSFAVVAIVIGGLWYLTQTIFSYESGTDWEKIGKTGVKLQNFAKYALELGAVMAIFAGFLALTRKFVGGMASFEDNMMSLIAIGAAIELFWQLSNQIVDIKDLRGAYTRLGYLSAFIASMGAIMTVFAGFMKITNMLIGSVEQAEATIISINTVGAVASAMFGLSQLFKMNDTSDNFESLSVGLVQIGLALAALGGCLRLMSVAIGDSSRIGMILAQISLIGALLLGMWGLGEFLIRFDILGNRIMKAVESLALLALALTALSVPMLLLASMGEHAAAAIVSMTAIGAIIAGFEGLALLASVPGVAKGLKWLIIIMAAFVGVALGFAYTMKILSDAFVGFADAYDKLATCGDISGKLDALWDSLKSGIGTMLLFTVAAAGMEAAFIGMGAVLGFTSVFPGTMKALLVMGIIASEIWIITDAVEKLTKALKTVEEVKLLAGGISEIKKDIKEIIEAVVDGILAVKDKIISFVADLLLAPLTLLPSVLVQFFKEFIIELVNGAGDLTVELVTFLKEIINSLNEHRIEIGNALISIFTSTTDMIVNSTEVLDAFMKLIEAFVTLLYNYFMNAENRERIKTIVGMIIDIVNQALIDLMGLLVNQIGMLMARLTATLDQWLDKVIPWYNNGGKTYDELVKEYAEFYGVDRKYWDENYDANNGTGSGSSVHESNSGREHGGKNSKENNDGMSITGDETLKDYMEFYKDLGYLPTVVKYQKDAALRAEMRAANGASTLDATVLEYEEESFKDYLKRVDPEGKLGIGYNLMAYWKAKTTYTGADTIYGYEGDIDAIARALNGGGIMSGSPTQTADVTYNVDAGAIQVTVYAPEGMDTKEVADAVSAQLLEDITKLDKTRGLSGNWFKY